jgi:hypothetical protein
MCRDGHDGRLLHAHAVLRIAPLTGGCVGFACVEEGVRVCKVSGARVHE